MLNFLGIGAQKCGTTWLYELLALHPQVRFPAGKEVHFWDRQRERGIDWYRGLFEGQPHAAAVGEITPAYAVLAPNIIAEVAQVFPVLRLIYMIRNPVDRAWSSALMAMQRAELQIDEVSDRWFIDHFESRGSRARGDYEACIRNWRAAYLSDQLLLIRYEHIGTQPFEVYQRSCSHLGIEAYDTPQVRAQASRVVFAGTGDPIRPSLSIYLHDMYRQPILALSSYLETDFSDWIMP
jgi:hypothetical protein